MVATRRDADDDGVHRLSVHRRCDLRQYRVPVPVRGWVDAVPDHACHEHHEPMGCSPLPEGVPMSLTSEIKATAVEERNSAWNPRVSSRNRVSGALSRFFLASTLAAVA